MQEAATQRNGMRWMSWRQTSDSLREDGGPMTTCNPSSQTYTGAKPQIPSLVTCFHGVCGRWTEVTSVMGGFWSERDRDANNVFTQRGNAVVAASHSKAQASSLQGGRSTYCFQKVPLALGGAGCNARPCRQAAQSATRVFCVPPPRRFSTSAECWYDWFAPEREPLSRVT